jgi:large subunit ribosomal protein L35
LPSQKLKEIMPKSKTNSGAKKRFKVTGSGKIKRAKAFKRHLLGRKSKKRKEELSKSAVVFKGDEYRVKLMLGMA